mgnify:FL=1
MNEEINQQIKYKLRELDRKIESMFNTDLQYSNGRMEVERRIQVRKR